MFGRLAMGFANVRAGTRVLTLVLVLVLVQPSNGRWPPSVGTGKQADTPFQLRAMEYAAKQAAQLGKPLYITEWSSDPVSAFSSHPLCLLYREHQCS